MKKVIALALGLVSVSAMAATHVAFDSRLDVQHDHYKQNKLGDGSTGITNKSVIKFQTLEAKMHGDLVQDVKYVLDYSFTESFAFDKSSVPTPLKNAYVHKDVMKGLNIAAGYQFATGGGMENAYADSDLYSASNVLTGDYLNTSAGVKLSYTFMNHLITAQFLNTASNNKLTKNFEFIGSFMDGKITPVLGYNHGMRGDISAATQTVAAVENSTGSNVLKNIGLGIEMANMKFEVDYMKGKQEKAGTRVGSATFPADIEDTSAVVRLTYLGEKFRPMIAYIHDKTTDKGAATATGNFKAKTYDVALQYYPKKDENFRYHFAASMFDKDFTAQGKYDPKGYKLYLGMKYNFSIL